ncbi:MAG TPA: hypothetical protein VJ739_03195 [Gemmataceae bacterium]|nr:hypothetical protein [Gemmataceae bacterium]
MYPRAADVLLGLIATLTAGAVLVLGLGARPSPQHEERSRAFQRLVGGLGFGPSADLADCPFGFDPRLDPGGGADLGPLPGGIPFCPRRSCSVFYYPPLRAARQAPGG